MPPGRGLGYPAIMHDSVRKRAQDRALSEQREQVARTLKRAFPLPESGSFNDLLAAIDLVQPKRR